MSHVFQESFRFTSSYKSPGRRGFPLAVALKKFWLCFAPRYAPLLWYKGEVDPYAQAPTQHLFQEDRSKDVDASGIRFTQVSTSRIPSIAEFVSSFPFIKNLRLDLTSTFNYQLLDYNFNSSLAPLSQMRLLTHLTLAGVTRKQLSEIANVSVKNLHLRYFKGEDLSSLFPQQEQQQGGRLQRSLRRLTLYGFVRLTDISALARFEALLELKLDDCSSLTDLSAISKLKELRVVRVGDSRNLGMNSFVKAITSLEFLLELDISFCVYILDEHVRKIATIETLEKLKLTFLRASSDSLSLLLDPQNLPNLRELEFELWDPTSSPLKHCAGSGTCVNLEKLDLRFHVKLDSTDLSIIPKKFPNLKALCLCSDFEDGTDFTPLGHLICLSELALHFHSYPSIQSASLEAAIAKLVNLKKLEFKKLSDVDVKKMLAPLRKLEVLAFQSENEASTTNAILDLVENEGHYLPVLSKLGFFSEKNIPELLQDRRKQQIVEEEEEEEEQKPKHGQEELQAARREREEEESETGTTVKKKKKKKFRGY